MPTADQTPSATRAAMLEHERLTARANDWLHVADGALSACVGADAVPDVEPESLRVTIAAAHAAAALALAYETRAGRIAEMLR
jgi:hypothetical protein